MVRKHGRNTALPINDIFKELEKVKAYGVYSIVVQYNQGTMPYRTDGLGSSKTPDAFLEFICRCSDIGNNISRLEIDCFSIPTDNPLKPKLEWSIYLVVSNLMSKNTNITPEVIEGLYNSFSNVKKS